MTEEARQAEERELSSSNGHLGSLYCFKPLCKGVATAQIA